MFIKQRLFQILANLKFSIFILLLISFCSVLGTVIEQDQSLEIYKLNYPIDKPVFNIFSWDVIIKFGLDHIYKTWWFLTLIILFGLSLTLCSFLQQLPSLKIARRCQFFRKKGRFNRLKISILLDSISLTKILYRIKMKQYSIFHQRNIFYCYKGLIGQFAPIIVHFSILLILVGTILGSLFGFKAQEVIPKTETFHTQNIISSGTFTRIPQTSYRINDFWITYTKPKIISQFYSDVSILNHKGIEIKRQTLLVNFPLMIKGIYYYQTDWNLLGLRIQNKEGQIIEYPVVNIINNKNKIWLSWIKIKQEPTTSFIVTITNLEGYCSIYKETGEFVRNIDLNEFFTMNNSFLINDILSSTGLQIKTDPGIPIIYLGFFFLMISISSSYQTYSQIWIVNKKKDLIIGGTTTRALFKFELEFFEFTK